MQVQVECGEGYQGEPTPHRLQLGHRTIEIAEVIDRWLATDHRYFKVKGQDGAAYILRHDVRSQVWQLVMFDRRPA